MAKRTPQPAPEDEDRNDDTEEPEPEEGDDDEEEQEDDDEEEEGDDGAADGGEQPQAAEPVRQAGQYETYGEAKPVGETKEVTADTITLDDAQALKDPFIRTLVRETLEALEKSRKTMQKANGEILYHKDRLNQLLGLQGRLMVADQMTLDLDYVAARSEQEAAAVQPELPVVAEEPAPADAPAEQPAPPAEEALKPTGDPVVDLQAAAERRKKRLTA